MLPLANQAFCARASTRSGHSVQRSTTLRCRAKADRALRPAPSPPGALLLEARKQPRIYPSFSPGSRVHLTPRLYMCSRSLWVVTAWQDRKESCSPSARRGFKCQQRQPSLQRVYCVQGDGVPFVRRGQQEREGNRRQPRRNEWHARPTWRGEKPLLYCVFQLSVNTSVALLLSKT